MAYLNLLFIFFKQFVAFFYYYIQYKSYTYSIILLSLVLLTIYFINYIKKQPSKEPLLEQIMWYRFEYDFERYHSIFMVVSSIVIYISSFFYLRYLSINKILNLREFNTMLKTFVLESPLIITITALLLLLALFYLVFILFFCIMRSYFTHEAMKLHFYYLDKPLYEKIFSYIKFNFSLIGTPYSLFITFYNYCNNYLALGYQINSKSKPFRLATTQEDELLENTWLYRYVKRHYFFNIMSKLHYFVLLLVLIYDLFFNDLLIQNTFKILPWLFIYQVYIAINNFLEGKSLDDICAYTNIYFYHDVVHVGNDCILIDGELHQLLFNFADRFLEYKANNFSYK